MNIVSKVACSFLVVACLLGKAAAGYSNDILPILADHCFQCHGPDAKERKADLRLDTEEGSRQAIVPGKPQSSALVERILSQDPDEIMPPPESNLSLSDTEKAALVEWIEEGAAYQKHWAFVAPERPEVPDVGEANPIDAFVRKRLLDEGLDFSSEASPERLLRRLSLDLNGLPPTPEDVAAFVAHYRADGEMAYQSAIDRLLGSPRYGETMALPWLDAARFADTDGYQFDGPRFMWRWRDWVIDAYNAKMPFDQFTIEQLAGDLLPEATLEQRLATGFNRNHRYNSEAGAVPEEFLLENAVDRVDTTSTLWMGLTMGCARCHDHKYDPISQKEYYQLIAYFNSVPESGRAIKARNSEPVMTAPTVLQQGELLEKERALAALRTSAEEESNELPVSEESVLVDRHLAHRFVEKPTEFDGEASTQLIKGIAKGLRFRASDAFTVSLWLRPDDVEQDRIILSRQAKSSTRPGIELALVDGGKLRFDLVTRWLAGVGRVTTEERLQPGEWVHVAISNDGSQSANGQHVYLNGRRLASDVHYNTNSNVGGVNEKLPLLLGHGPRPGSGRFHGALRDVRLYETNLWPEEMNVLGAEKGSATRQRYARLTKAPSYQAYVREREALDAFRNQLPTVMVMKEAPSPKLTHVRDRGVYDQLGEQVARGVPALFPPLDGASPKDRLGFARWLVSGNHPLTARVAVNRYWQKYFGTGLVKTAEDFGVQGEKPSHPALLDWLASEFVRTGWDVAGMQRLIVSSRTYRQRAHLTDTLRERDPENRLLARGARLRLSGQAIRDQALQLAGLLVERSGGPSVYPYQPKNLWAEMSMGMKYKQSKGADLYRRSLYTVWKRTVAPPTMAVFDSADREVCWVSRKVTNTPLQALTLLNETGFVESARHLAVRLLKETDDPVGYGYRLLTAREPTSRERDLFQRALAEYREHFLEHPKEAAELIAVGDSSTSAAYSAVELAAMTALANVLLNLDEAITKE